MSLPGRPLRELLDARTSEREIHEVWRGVKARREARRSRRPFVLAAACAVAALLVVVFVRRPAGLPPTDRDAQGPLAVVSGAHERPLTGGDAILTATELSDGSRVALGPGARLSIVENSGRTFVTHLEGGRADFSVKPGGPRRWVVECGRATVEVVGTEFTVDRSPLELRVDVRHGVVLVRGDDVPDHLRRLVVGDTLRLAAPPSIAAPPSAEAALPVAPPSTVAPPTATSSVPLAAENSAARAAPSLEPAAPEPAPSALYDEADRARRAGRADDAARLLESAVAAEPRGHRAAIACFTLGRLYLDELGKPNSAARAFERSLAAGAPLGLEEDVRVRLVEARVKASDTAGARRAAEQYRARFPAGRRLADVERWSPE